MIMGRIRVGLIVPRYKQSAVARNRLKRQLRELVRLKLLPSGLVLDIVIRTRPETYGVSYEHLMDQITWALLQLDKWTAGVHLIRHHGTSVHESRDP